MAQNLKNNDKEGRIIHPDYPHIKLPPAQDQEKILDLQAYIHDSSKKYKF